MKRLTKEYKLDICDNINLKYGTVNKDNPQVIYISGTCWISPQKDNINYDNVLSIIKRHIRQDIKQYLIHGDYFDDKFILDFETTLDDALMNDKKYLSFDLYLRQYKDNVRKMRELDSFINEKIGILSNNIVALFEKNNFAIAQKKNETDNKIDRIGFTENHYNECKANNE